MPPRLESRHWLPLVALAVSRNSVGTLQILYPYRLEPHLSLTRHELSQ